MLKSIIKFIRDEEGATAVEYGLIVGLIAVIIIVALQALGGDGATTGISGLFQSAADALPTPP